jgi:hypothetical protein
MGFEGPYKPSVAQAKRNEYFKTRPGGMGYGLNRKQFAQATASDHFRRAASFAVGSGGAIKEDALNTLGFLSKHQKSQMQNSVTGRIMSRAIPAATILGIGATYNEGGGFGDYLTGMALPEIAGLAGWRVGKSLGMGTARAMKPGKKNLIGQTSSLNKRTRMASYASKMVVGGLARGAGTAISSGVGTFAMGIAGGATGFLAAGALAAGVGEIINTAGDSDNAIKRNAEDARRADFITDIDVTSSTLTHRRQALDQLSKSSLNNRGQLFGNEASILSGIM